MTAAKRMSQESTASRQKRRPKQKHQKPQQPPQNSASQQLLGFLDITWEDIEAFLESRVGVMTSVMFLCLMAGVVALRVSSRFHAASANNPGGAAMTRQEGGLSKHDIGGGAGAGVGVSSGQYQQYFQQSPPVHANPSSLFGFGNGGATRGSTLDGGGSSVGAGDISRMLQGQVDELQSEHADLQSSYLAHRQENTFLREWFQRMHAEALQFVPSYKKAYTAKNQQLLRDGSDDAENESSGGTTQQQQQRMMQKMGQAYTVVIPVGVSPGAEFEVQVQESVYVVTCPPYGRPGEIMAFDVPDTDFFQEQSSSSSSSSPSSQKQAHQQGQQLPPPSRKKQQSQTQVANGGAGSSSSSSSSPPSTDDKLPGLVILGRGENTAAGVGGASSSSPASTTVGRTEKGAPPAPALNTGSGLNDSTTRPNPNNNPTSAESSPTATTLNASDHPQ